jgi:hypothetical protein
MEFQEQVEKQLQGLDRKQICRFAWLCGVRALPFLSAGKRGFTYWPKENRHMFLYSVFRALDFAAYDIYDNTFASAAAEDAATAAAVAAAHIAFAKADAANHVAHAATYAANTANAYVSTYLNAVNAASAASAAANDAMIDRQSFGKLLVSDIEAIKTGNLASLINDTRIYVDIWQNFLDDLNSASCGYWVRFYKDLFQSRFEIDEVELQRRLSVPTKIREQGAAMVGLYLDRTSQLQKSPDIITETPKEDITTKAATASQDETERNKSMTNRTEVFISYSHKDKVYIDRLSLFLKQLVLNYDIIVWYDQMLKIGAEWKKEIREHISVAKVAILMVSQNFIDSEFIRNEELPELLQAAKDENATIMWVPVTVSTVRDTRIKGKNDNEICIADYQAVCDPKKPLSNMGEHERDEIYNRLYEDIKSRFGYHE